MGRKKEFIRKQELVVWIANARKKEIDESACSCSRRRFLESLRDDPDNQIVQIYSKIYDWKIRAEDDTGLTVEQMDEDDDRQVAQQVVDKLLSIFSAEIDRLRRG
jgi:hypothetical protein